MTDSILDIADLEVRYRTSRGDNTAVKGVNLTVERGEILGIAGESGCGKTTLATSILGLLRPPGYVAGGVVSFHPQPGRSIDLLTAGRQRLRAVRWRNLSYLPQGSMNSLNPVVKISKQFQDVMRHQSDLGKRQIQERIPELLESVGLDPAVAAMYPHELSGGMKQRVIIAIAIALEPDLVIADEPTTALDVTVQRLILQNLAELRDRLGLTILLITHDMGVHAQLVDRVAIMYRGEIVETGDVEQVFTAPGHPYTKALINSIPTLDVDQRNHSGTTARREKETVR